VSTSADIAALCSVWKRLLKPEPRITLQKSDRPATGTMAFLTNRDNLATTLPAINPGIEQTLSVMGTTVTRRVPLQHPDFAGLYAVGWDVQYRYGTIDGYGTADASSENLAIVTVNFESLPYAVSGDDPYLNVNVSNYDREIPVDAVTFAGGGTPGYEIGKDATGLRYAMTVFNAPGVDKGVEAFWWANANKVNSDTFRDIPPGYVQFKGPQLDYKYLNDGTRVCNYTLTFDASPVKWNQLYTRAGALDDLYVGGAARYGSVAIGSLWR
jgi:hypothetical protein